MANKTTSTLTKRERQVTALIGKAFKYKDIAIILGLGSETVKTYAARIRQKLNVNSKVAVALWALHNLNEDGTEKEQTDAS